jgi:hypothetical protein
VRTWSSFIAWRSLRSAPAQNAGPAARTSTTRTAVSAPTRFTASSSAMHIARSSALRWSGG